MIERALKQEKVAEQQGQQYREFAGGFLYDILCFTPPSTITDEDRRIVEDGLDLIESVPCYQKQITTEDIQHLQVYLYNHNPIGPGNPAAHVNDWIVIGERTG
jgi:hypothetical protein